MAASQMGWIDATCGASVVPVRVSRPENESPPLLVVLSGGAEAASGIAAYADRWAEEGYLTVAMQVGAARLHANELVATVQQIADKHAVAPSTPVGILAFDQTSAYAPQVATALKARAVCLIEPTADAVTAIATIGLPCIAHVSGPSLAPPADSILSISAYPAAKPGFALPGSAGHDVFAARLVLSRTLTLFRRELGPRWDLAALFREHLRLEFEARDADATMETMVDEPYVNHVPTMTGGTGHDLLKRFYKYHFIPSTPKDRKTIILSEMVSADAVVLEAINCFTHNEPYDHFLPGVAPTGKYLEIPFVAVAKFKGDKLFYEQIYWDQASVLVQLGLIDRKGLPVTGREQADKVRDPSLPSNELMTAWPNSEGKPL